MLSVRYYLKEAKATGQTTVYALCAAKQCKFPKLYTALKLKPDQWDSKGQQFRRNFPSYQEANRLLTNITAALQDTFLKAAAKGKDCTADDLKAAMAKAQNLQPAPAKGSRTFFEHFEAWLELCAKHKAAKTIAAYRTTYKHLQAYAKAKPFRFDFDRMTMPFYYNLLDYLQTTAKLNNNSTGKIIKNLKVFLTWAYETELHDRQEFRRFKVLQHEPEVIYLTAAEKAAISLLDLSNAPHLDRTRDMFIFQCETGLRNSDVLALRHEHVKESHLLIRTAKTADLLNIPLSPTARQILQKYSHLPRPLPFKSNQKANVQLKEIAQLAGLETPTTTHTKRGGATVHTTRPKWELITAHVARKTFVTLSLEAGARPETVMKITGHKDYKTMKRYLKITETVVQQEMQRIWERETLMKAV